MKVLEGIKSIFKGIGVFFIVYIVISGNGDDTFCAWVLMFASLVLTILFLDETKNKFVLVLITLVMSAICSDGFDRAFPFLLCICILLLVYCKWGCGAPTSQWSAINMLNPLERYSYSFEDKCLIIKRGLPPFVGKRYSYPISVFVNTERMDEDYNLFWCEVKIPVNYNANSDNPTQVVLKNISKKKYEELCDLLSGKVSR